MTDRRQKYWQRYRQLYRQNCRQPYRSLWQGYSGPERARHLGRLITWQAWKRTIGKPIIIYLFNGCRFLAYPDCTVSSTIIYLGAPEWDEIHFLRSRLTPSTMPSIGCLVDIGANVGGFTMMLADLFEEALLFEPNPIAAQRARENIVLNSLRYEVIEMAMSDEKGYIFLEDKGGVDTSNRTLTRDNQSDEPIRRVERTTLDEVILGGDGPRSSYITLLKIDVEGHENAVLRGSSRVLNTLRPPLIMFEYLQRTDIKETLRLLSENEYCVYRLSQGVPELVDQAVAPLQNLFASPREALPGLSIRLGTYRR